MNEPQNTFEARFLKHVQEHDLIRATDSVLLAVSGGVDSMVLLHLFTQIKKTLDLKLSVAHINHGIRGKEAEEDAQLVREVAEYHNLPFYITQVDTNTFASSQGYSRQEAGRILRYQFLEKIAEEVKTNRIATGHHADDNAETVLFHILRGTGLRGLGGIPVTRNDGKIIRPLLFARRSEIETYATTAGIEFHNDSSNASEYYTRNLLRNKIIPYLKQETRFDIVTSLNNISSIVSDVRTALSHNIKDGFDRSVRISSENECTINIPNFASLHSYVQEEILLQLLDKLQLEPSRDRIESLLQLRSKQTGKQLTLSRLIIAYRDRDEIIIHKKSTGDSFSIPVELGKSYCLDTFEFSAFPTFNQAIYSKEDKQVEYVDGEKLKSELCLRNWKEGDSFIPLGMNSFKKLSDFFVDEKIPRYLKNNVPVLESDGKIVWVCGMRIDERFKITPSTTSFVQLNYHPLRTG